jgi:hypothetical protein
MKQLVDQLCPFFVSIGEMETVVVMETSGEQILCKSNTIRKIIGALRELKEMKEVEEPGEELEELEELRKQPEEVGELEEVVEEPEELQELADIKDLEKHIIDTLKILELVQRTHGRAYLQFRIDTQECSVVLLWCQDSRILCRLET